MIYAHLEKHEKMLPKHATANGLHGFTLVELSIVLVIIGLLVGGILVGKDLINAASIRAQISQIEKYQTAVKAFRLKYNAMPGDMSADAANAFGFTARGSFAGEGDNNGLIEGVFTNSSGSNFGAAVTSGECLLFWIDLSQANLVDAGITASGKSLFTDNVPGPGLMEQYIPKAKIGMGWVYVWSGGWILLGNGGGIVSDGINYFGLSWVYHGDSGNTSLTPQQAFAMDTKMDDGLPQSGRVMAMYSSQGFGGWAIGGPVPDGGHGNDGNGDYSTSTGGAVTNSADIGDGAPYGPMNCYDGNTGLPEKYSLKNTSPNCALSFQFH
jgi:prepilin-type N-terminal cleavage/methylation domain-containing protein